MIANLPVSDSSTLRSAHVRGVKHAVRIGANGVAFWGGAADMNAMRPPYSYRHDPSVPPFADDKPVIIFDGYCALCSGWASFVLRHDRAGDVSSALRAIAARARALRPLRPRSAGLRDQYPDRRRRGVVQIGRLDPHGRRARLPVVARGGLSRAADGLARPALRNASRATGCAGSASARAAIAPTRALPTGSSHEPARPHPRRLRHVRRTARAAARRRGAPDAHRRGALAQRRPRRSARRWRRRRRWSRRRSTATAMRTRSCRRSRPTSWSTRAGRSRPMAILIAWCAPPSRAASTISISPTARTS